MKIKYFDIETQITMQQAELLSFHTKRYYDDDDQIIKDELFFNYTNIEMVWYYRSTETDADIISQYINIPTVTSIDIIDKETYGPFIINNYKLYQRDPQTQEFYLRNVVLRNINNIEHGVFVGEHIDNDLPDTDPEKRGVTKIIYLGQPGSSEYPTYEVTPDITIEYISGDGSNIYRAIMNPKSYYVDGSWDDQDMENLDENEILKIIALTPQWYKDWILSDVFLPPIGLV